MSIINLFKEKDPLDKLLTKLHDEDYDRREDALKKIEKMDIGVKEGLKLLDWSKQKFPPSEFEWIDISSRLIDIVAKYPQREYVDKVVGIFDFVSLPAKISILLFLAEYEVREAMEAYIKLLGKIYMDLRGLPAGNLIRRPRHADLIFPAVLKYIDNKYLSRDIYHVLLCYFNEGLVNEDYLGEYKNEIVKDILYMADKVREYDFGSYPGSMWDDEEYLEIRSYAGVHFDLAGYIKDIRVIKCLNELLSINDIRLKMFATVSLLKHNCEVEAEHFEDIAKSNEMRNWFYNALDNMNRLELFPEEYVSQEKFAESNMVDWLCYPTELGREPDEIELMNIFEDSKYEFYLFRFRSDSEGWKEKGWMAGLAGPFKAEEIPTINSSGYTFSRFDEWDSKSPEDHFKDIINTVRGFYSFHD